MEGRRGRRGQISPGEERGNATGKVAIAHGSVECYEAAPTGLADESWESLYGRETDRDHLRNADLRRNPKTLRGLARALSESALECAVIVAMVICQIIYYSVLPGCNNLWACMKILKVLFLCISSLPSSHPSHPRTWSRTQLMVQGVTNADNGGPGTVKVPL